MFASMKTIQITTAHNVEIEFEQAQLRERAFAFVIDCMAVFAIWLLSMTIFQGLRRTGLGDSFESIFGILPLVFFWAWMAGGEILSNGQTLGKKAMKIRTIRLDGQHPGWSDLLARAFLHMIDTFLSVGFIGFLLIKTTEKGQRLGDMVAGTCVIRLRPERFVGLHDVLAIGTTASYRPVFPQVRQLRESDVLAIKTCLTRASRFRNQAHEDLLIDLSDRVAKVLGIEKTPIDRSEFLRTVVRDYVILTR